MLANTAGAATTPSVSEPGCSNWLDTPEGAAAFAKRGTTVEPVFGNLKANLGYRRSFIKGASAPLPKPHPPDTEGGVPIESGVGATPSSVHQTNPLLGLERLHVWHTRRATSSTPQNRVVRRCPVTSLKGSTLQGVEIGAVVADNEGAEGCSPRK